MAATAADTPATNGPAQSLRGAAFAASLAGAEADVLVERVGPDGSASGWTGQYLRARIPDRTPADAGALLRVRVLRAEGDLLLVRPI